MDTNSKQDLWTRSAIVSAAVTFLVALAILVYARRYTMDLLTFIGGFMVISFGVMTGASKLLFARADGHKPGTAPFGFSVAVCLLGFAMVLRPAFFAPHIERVLYPSLADHGSSLASAEPTYAVSDVEWEVRPLRSTRFQYTPWGAQHVRFVVPVRNDERCIEQSVDPVTAGRTSGPLTIGEIHLLRRLDDYADEVLRTSSGATTQWGNVAQQLQLDDECIEPTPYEAMLLASTHIDSGKLHGRIDFWDESKRTTVTYSGSISEDQRSSSALLAERVIEAVVAGIQLWTAEIAMQRIERSPDEMFNRMTLTQRVRPLGQEHGVDLQITHVR